MMSKCIQHTHACICSKSEAHGESTYLYVTNVVLRGRKVGLEVEVFVIS